MVATLERPTTTTPTALCVVCGAPLDPERVRLTHAKLCGNPDCRLRRRRQNARDEYHLIYVPKQPRPHAPRPRCAICGQEVPKLHRRYCGDAECQRIAARVKVRAWFWERSHPGEPQPPTPERPIYCAVCGRPIPDRDWGFPRLTCSAYCRRVRDADKRREAMARRRITESGKGGN